jgi:acetyl esterase/lipase
LDVYRPTKSSEAGRVVVFFYGGHWQSGNKSDYFFVAQALASRGFVAVLPDYRLYPNVTFPAFVRDGAAAVRWVHDNISRFGGDPEKVYLMGHSAGAHIAALLTLDGAYLKDVGLSRNAIRATAALSGPYDFVPAPQDRGVFGMGPTDSVPSAQIEPVHFVDGHAAPMLLLQGLKDQTVKPENTARLAAKIKEAGGDVRVIEYPDRAHVGVVLALAWPFRWLDPVLDDTVKFFSEH